ncbi:MAG: hypothetical protein CML04_09450 [Pseudozobellia sp.]|nr:hypothetical protein [Pseudozobellia sp.]|tara:strand:- start:6619 stop:7476 length:858 start_codon:yes stop_codon:yes gene_type:complete
MPMKSPTKIFIILLSPLLMYCQEKVSAEEMIQTIITETEAATVNNTVDIVKEGDPETTVKGVVTCMFATMDVLRKAVAKNCNLIIAHEPLYYNHLDNTDKFQGDPVFEEKKKFILDNGLVVWRFHDYVHRIRPDAIMSGIIERLGWQENIQDGNYYKFEFPQTTLNELLIQLKKTFPDNAFHVVGNKDMPLTNVAFVPGASGTDAHISQLRKNDVDVVIAGEVPQWETYEYVRDAVLQGRNKAIVFLGHINSEEAGMEFAAKWMRDFVTDIPVEFIECESSYFTY